MAGVPLSQSKPAFHASRRLPAVKLGLGSQFPLCRHDMGVLLGAWTVWYGNCLLAAVADARRRVAELNYEVILLQGTADSEVCEPRKTPVGYRVSIRNPDSGVARLEGGEPRKEVAVRLGTHSSFIRVLSWNLDTGSSRARRVGRGTSPDHTRCWSG